MENTENNSVVEESVVETPVVEEAQVAEAPIVEETPIDNTTVEVPKSDAITAPAYASSNEEVQAIGPVDNGVMGTKSVPKREPRPTVKSIKEDLVEKVAIYSTKNVDWEEVGKVYKGYNIVTQEIADKWLTRSHVRLATPEEVKKAFG
jgi:hypothetical protein